MNQQHTSTILKRKIHNPMIQEIAYERPRRTSCRITTVNYKTRNERKRIPQETTINTGTFKHKYESTR